ncbi:hypothetical protein FYA55_09125 [Bordetella holmesii]|nr:hypothetical protein FYA55_09125 [Bordetella holmesii]
MLKRACYAQAVDLMQRQMADLRILEIYGPASCEDSIGCMHGSSEPDLRNWKSPTPQFTQGARPDEHP